MEYTVTQNNVHIKDSYKITDKSEMISTLAEINALYPTCDVWERSTASLVREWRAHNRLHKLGIFKSRTADVDLDVPQKWYYKIGYFVLGV